MEQNFNLNDKGSGILRDIASYCIENSKKLGATDVGVKVIHSVSENVSFRNKKLDESNRADSFAVNLTTYIAVSYTHLTLPTKRIV